MLSRSSRRTRTRPAGTRQTGSRLPSSLLLLGISAFPSTSRTPTYDFCVFLPLHLAESAANQQPNFSVRLRPPSMQRRSSRAAAHAADPMLRVVTAGRVPGIHGTPQDGDRGCSAKRSRVPRARQKLIRSKLLRFLDSKPEEQAITGAQGGRQQFPASAGLRGRRGRDVGSWYVPINRVLIAAASDPKAHPGEAPDHPQRQAIERQRTPLAEASVRRAEKRSAFRGQTGLPVRPCSPSHGHPLGPELRPAKGNGGNGQPRPQAQSPRLNRAKEAEGAALFRPTRAAVIVFAPRRWPRGGRRAGILGCLVGRGPGSR